MKSIKINEVYIVILFIFIANVTMSQSNVSLYQLHAATKDLDYDKVDKILKAGTDPNLKDGTGRTALHYAAMHGEKDIIELLVVSADANLNVIDNQGETPLDCAIEKGHYEIAKKLLNYSANARLAKKGLERVIATKNEELLIMLLQNKADANLAMTKAIEADNPDYVDLILDNSEARVTNQMFEKAVTLKRRLAATAIVSRGLDKERAMDFVIQKRDKEMVDMILSLTPDISTTNKALVFLVEQRDMNLVKRAIETHNADPTVGLTPAVKNNHLEMVQYLISKGANPDEQINEAASQGNKAIVELLLSQSANPDLGVASAAENNQTAILQILLDAYGDANLAMPIAIEKGDIAMVNMCIAAPKPADVYRGEYIVKTCEKSNLDVLYALLLAGADPNPGMIISISKRDMELVRELVNAGADVSKPDYLMKSAELNANGIAQLLIDNGADPNPGMAIAVKKNNVGLVNSLISAGANPNKPEYLIESAQKNFTDIAQILLSAGADPNPGMPIAINKNNERLVGELIASGANVNNPEFLISAADKKNASIVQLLLNNGVDPNPGMPIAVKKGDETITGMLIQKGADATPPQYMINACRMGKSSIVSMLISAGADPNNGMSEAVKYNKADVVQVLLENGADGSSDSYMLASVNHNNPDLTSLLIEGGGNPQIALEPAVNEDAYMVVGVLCKNGVDLNNPKLLYTCVYNNYTRSATELVNAGVIASEWWDNEKGENLLHLSIERHLNAEMVGLLVKGGIDVDQENRNGDSPLHLAVYQGSFKKNAAGAVVRSLITAGADVNAVNKNGETVLKAAPGKKEITKPLKDAGAVKRI